MALLVQNLERLDESVKEEADGVHNTLGKWLLHSPLLLSVVCTKGSELSLPFLPPLLFSPWTASTAVQDLVQLLFKHSLESLVPGASLSFVPWLHERCLFPNQLCWEVQVHGSLHCARGNHRTV